jgi:spore maturation protein CgeB
MRFLLLSTDYPDFLKWLYSQHPGLEMKPYKEQARVRADSLFSLADFYSSNLQTLGHEAWDVDVNNEFMQRAWARQHGLKVNEGPWQFRLRRGLVPWLSRSKDAWFYDVLGAQIKFYKPDVLLTHWIGLDSTFLREMKPYVRLLVGSHASPLRGERDLSVYDLMLSVVDNFVDYFRSQGVQSERLRFGFEPRVLARFNGSERSIPVSFVGNVSRDHASRLRWLDHVCQNHPVQVWLRSLSELPNGSPIIGCHRGTAWGAEMFDILHKSRITLNHHVDVAESYAGNVRLFEATGCGSLLITDWKKNLHEIFEPEKEVVAYRTPEECVEMMKYYLEHDDERETIARAGQQRTRRDHTFHNRMQQLSDIVRKYL